MKWKFAGVPLLWLGTNHFNSSNHSLRYFAASSSHGKFYHSLLSFSLLKALNAEVSTNHSLRGQLMRSETRRPFQLKGCVRQGQVSSAIFFFPFFVSLHEFTFDAKLMTLVAGLGTVRAKVCLRCIRSSGYRWIYCHCSNLLLFFLF